MIKLRARKPASKVADLGMKSQSKSKILTFLLLSLKGQKAATVSNIKDSPSQQVQGFGERSEKNM